MILDVLSWVCLMAGAFLGITGAVGLFRFPDFYSRVHAASITDTLCALLIVIGLMFQGNSLMAEVKLLMIVALIAYTSPTAAHALAKSARHGGLKPWTGEEGKG